MSTPTGPNKPASESLPQQVSDLETRVHTLEHPPPPSPEKLKAYLEKAGVPAGWLDKHASVSDQTLYASSQWLNFNPSAATLAPELLNVGTTGVSVAGVQILDFFDSDKVRNKIRGILHLSTEVPVGEQISTIQRRMGIIKARIRAADTRIDGNDTRLGEHGTRLGEHGTAISRLATQLAEMARVEAGEAQVGANAARVRAQAASGRTTRIANEAESQRLERSADQLRAVRTEAQHLADTLG
jgi:hypothetical protein